jgi:DNA-binding transcriptional LysR family regulator
MLDVRRLQIFMAVAEHGSFTAAAEALFMTHSAVSQQMALLERQLGVPLMTRGPRGVDLTEAGRLLAERSTGLLGTMAAVERELRDLKSQQRSVRLGAFPTAGAELVPRVVREFRRRHPDTRLLLRSAPAADMAAVLRAGAVHVGLVWDYDFLPRSVPADVEWLHLADDPVVLLLPADHALAGKPAVALSEFADEQWVVRGHSAPYDTAFATMCQLAGFEPRVGFQTGDYLSAQGLVAAGVGISAMPRPAVGVLHPDVRMVPLSEPAPCRRIAAMRLRNAVHPPAARQLLAVLRAACRNDDEHEAPGDGRPSLAPSGAPAGTA